MTEDFGVCRLSLVPVKNEPSSTQVTQLLFGDAYEVTGRSRDKSWLSIKTTFDQVEGWIHRHHHHAVSKEYYEQIVNIDFKISLDLVSTLLYKKNQLPILLGSIVPITSSELFKMDEQFAFNGEAKPISLKRDPEFIKSIALKYINAPEVEGGKGPFGICANGLVQMVFKISGYVLPWAITEQATSGKKVKDLASSRMGDIAFFADKKGAIHHAGIILGENKIIHSFGHVRVDYLTDEGIINAETKVFSHALSSIRRI